MIQLNGVSKSFDGQSVLRDVNLEIASGERLMLAGPSGCGKTTLVRLVCGLETPDTGAVLYERPLVFSCHFQENRLLPWYSVEKNLQLALPGRINISEWLYRAGLEETEHKLPGELSGGMKRRVSLLRALLFPSDVLLLDEPYRELDQSTVAQMIQLTEEAIGERTLILVTHQMEHGDALQCTPVDIQKWSGHNLTAIPQSSVETPWSIG